MTDEADTTVVVEVDESPEPETPADDAPDVVVVDTGSDGDSGNDLEIGITLGALAATVAEHSSRLDEIESRLSTTEVVAEAASETAIDAIVEVNEVVAEAEEIAEEAAEEVAEEFIEPQREHWLWRKPAKLRRSEVDA